MIDRPRSEPEPITQTYMAILLFGVAIIAVLAVAALCLGPTLGLGVKLYTMISGG